MSRAKLTRASERGRVASPVPGAVLVGLALHRVASDAGVRRVSPVPGRAGAEGLVAHHRALGAGHAEGEVARVQALLLPVGPSRGGNAGQTVGALCVGAAPVGAAAAKHRVRDVVGRALAGVGAGGVDAPVGNR